MSREEVERMLGFNKERFEDNLMDLRGVSWEDAEEWSRFSLLFKKWRRWMIWMEHCLSLSMPAWHLSMVYAWRAVWQADLAGNHHTLQVCPVLLVRIPHDKQAIKMAATWSIKYVRASPVPIRNRRTEISSPKRCSSEFGVNLTLLSICFSLKWTLKSIVLFKDYFNAPCLLPKMVTRVQELPKASRSD